MERVCQIDDLVIRIGEGPLLCPPEVTLSSGHPWSIPIGVVVVVDVLCVRCASLRPRPATLLLDRRTDGQSPSADGAWLGVPVVGLCHHAATLLLQSSQADPGSAGHSKGLQPKNRRPRKGTNPRHPLHVGQSLLGSFGMTLISTHAVPLLEVGPPGQLVFRVGHVVLVIVGVEDDTVPNRTHVVHTGEALPDLRHSHVQASHFAIDGAQNTLSPIGRARALQWRACPQDRSRCLSRRCNQGSRPHEPPISLHRCRCQLPGHPRFWTRSCSVLPRPRRQQRRSRSTSSRHSRQRPPRTMAPDSPQPTSSTSTSDSP